MFYSDTILKKTFLILIYFVVILLFEGCSKTAFDTTDYSSDKTSSDSTLAPSSHEQQPLPPDPQPSSHEQQPLPPETPPIQDPSTGPGSPADPGTPAEACSPKENEISCDPYDGTEIKTYAFYHTLYEYTREGALDMNLLSPIPLWKIERKLHLKIRQGTQLLPPPNSDKLICLLDSEYLFRWWLTLISLPIINVDYQSSLKFDPLNCSNFEVAKQIRLDKESCDAHETVVDMSTITVEMKKAWAAKGYPFFIPSYALLHEHKLVLTNECLCYDEWRFQREINWSTASVPIFKHKVDYNLKLFADPARCGL